MVVYYAAFPEQNDITSYTQAKFDNEGYLECFVSGQSSYSEWNLAELDC